MQFQLRILRMRLESGTRGRSAGSEGSDPIAGGYLACIERKTGTIGQGEQIAGCDYFFRERRTYITQGFSEDHGGYRGHSQCFESGLTSMRPVQLGDTADSRSVPRVDAGRSKDHEDRLGN